MPIYRLGHCPSSYVTNLVRQSHVPAAPGLLSQYNRSLGQMDSPSGERELKATIYECWRCRWRTRLTSRHSVILWYGCRVHRSANGLVFELDDLQQLLEHQVLPEIGEHSLWKSVNSTGRNNGP